MVTNDRLRIWADLTGEMMLESQRKAKFLEYFIKTQSVNEITIKILVNPIKNLFLNQSIPSLWPNLSILSGMMFFVTIQSDFKPKGARI